MTFAPLRGKKQRTFEDASLTAAAGSQVFQAKLKLKLLESVVLFHVMKMKCVSLPGSSTVKTITQAKVRHDKCDSDLSRAGLKIDFSRS